MIRYVFIFGFMILSQSCGMLLNGDVLSQGGTRQYNTTNPEFNSQISAFVTYAKETTQNSNFKLGDIPVNFGDTTQSQFDGVCLKYSNGQREVLIKMSWWNRATPKQREVLIFHELGHCSLNRSHYDEEIDNEKVSIMSSTVPNSNTYNDFKSEYLTELFTGDRTLIVNRLSN